MTSGPVFFSMTVHKLPTAHLLMQNSLSAGGGKSRGKLDGGTLPDFGAPGSASAENHYVD